MFWNFPVSLPNPVFCCLLVIVFFDVLLYVIICWAYFKTNILVFPDPTGYT